MTVDALTANGEFIGGLIVPGFDLMHEALAAHTGAPVRGAGSFMPFPRPPATQSPAAPSRRCAERSNACATPWWPRETANPCDSQRGAGE